MAEPGRGATNAPRDLILTKSLILSKGPIEFHDKASPHTAYRREEAEQKFLSFDVLTAPSASLEILPAPEFPKVDVGGGDNEAAPTNSYTRGSCGRLSLYTFPPETQSNPTYQNHANNQQQQTKTHRRSHTCCFSDNQTKGGRGRRRPRAPQGQRRFCDNQQRHFGRSGVDGNLHHPLSINNFPNVSYLEPQRNK